MTPRLLPLTLLAVFTVACQPPPGTGGTGGTGGGSGGAGGSGGGDALITAPSRQAKMVRFSRGQPETFIDETGRWYHSYSPVILGGRWARTDFGPVEAGYSASVECVVRPPARKVTCRAPGTNPSPLAVELAGDVNSTIVFRGTTSFGSGIIPGAGSEAHVFCGAGTSGFDCFRSGMTDLLWLPRIMPNDVKKLLRAHPYGGLVLTKGGRVRHCSHPQISTTVTCVEGPASLPNVVLEDAAGDETKGVGITTQGELVQWGQVAAAETPPAGTFKRFVGPVGSNGYIAFTTRACVLGMDDKMKCWSLSGAPVTLPDVSAEDYVDITLSSNDSLTTIGRDGVVKRWPGGTVIPAPAADVGLDACPLKPVTTATVCSEITKYVEATAEDYRRKCLAENGEHRPGQSCAGIHPNEAPIYVCDGMTINVDGKGLQGRTYFYRQYAGGCPAAKNACRAATTVEPPDCPPQ